MMNLGTPLQLICDIIDGVRCTVVLDKYYITTEIRECSNIRLSECSTSWECIKDTEYRLCEEEPLWSSIAKIYWYEIGKLTGSPLILIVSDVVLC